MDYKKKNLICRKTLCISYGGFQFGSVFIKQQTQGHSFLPLIPFRLIFKSL